MAYYPHEGDDDTARLREEAKRDTEIALEREQRQKEERKRQHEALVHSKIRQVEEKLRIKERELGGIELEQSHLERVVREGRTAPSTSSRTAVSALERLVRDVKAKLSRLTSDERTTDAELRTHTRTLEQMRTESVTENRSRTSVTTALERERTEAKELERSILELERQLKEKKARQEALVRDIEVAERTLSSTRADAGATTVHTEQQTVRELELKMRKMRDEERALSTELATHTRELEAAQGKQRDTEQEERERSEHARTAASRKTEHDMKKRRIVQEIEGYKREISTLTRELS